MANYLWERETDEVKREYLGDITQCAKELLDYCNSILDFSRIESGLLAVFEKKFNLKKLLDSSIKIEQPAAIYKQLQLKLDYDSSVPLFNW
ncbi:sensor histidine kinase [Coxiella endosymbiont of Ornithodoros maritimus]|uniref:sensor histidine kinase n=1 Tax=Coxiella endosymbiont of Ornithodoros maritimus TaxID=1656172 RepID=UPI0022644BA6|nr:histidine kinase dimerization/phospho-acceptor domain-containing protein [Coxiella endosymbiont of Ornithodoros maritimus]